MTTTAARRRSNQKESSVTTFTTGQKVTTSGFAGRVIRMYSAGMVEIRLASGVVCVPVCDVVAQ